MSEPACPAVRCGSRLGKPHIEPPLFDTAARDAAVFTPGRRILPPIGPDGEALPAWPASRVGRWTVSQIPQAGSGAVFLQRATDHSRPQC
jgi:hypothetical protein